MITVPDAPFPEMLPALADIMTRRREHFSGNVGLNDCPLFAGWKFQIGRYTTPEERKWLRDRGWQFSGGWWFLRDAEPYRKGTRL